MGRQANRSRPARRRASVASTSIGQQPLQRRGHRQRLDRGGVQHGGQRFGGVVEFQHRQVRAEALIAAAASAVPAGSGKWRCR